MQTSPPDGCGQTGTDRRRSAYPQPPFNDLASDKHTFSTGIRLRLNLAIMLAGFAMIIAAAIYSYARFDALQTRTEQLYEQQRTLDAFHTSILRSVVDLDQILYDGQRNLIGTLLAQNEDTLSLFAQYRTNSTDLEFDSDAFLAREYEPVILKLRKLFYVSVAYYRQGRVNAAIEVREGRLKFSLNAILTFVGRAHSRRAFLLYDQKQSMADLKSRLLWSTLIVSGLVAMGCVVMTSLVERSINFRDRAAHTRLRKSNDLLEEKQLLLEEHIIELRVSRDQITRHGTELAQFAEQLAQSRDLAEAANRAKSEFLANMSHELRTPLNAIIGFSEIIESQAFGSVGNIKYQDYAKDIHNSGQHLLSLINDILDLSKIESGMDELYEEDIEITDVIRSAQTLVKERAQRAGLALVVDCPNGLPPLHADERKLKQMLVNLLTNAIKVTETGGKVTLKVLCRAEDGFVFQVIDTGIGLAPEDIPKALSKFSQVDGAHTRKQEGTGLGLPLTKSLIEQHGGSLDLQSELGVGTTVTLHFPAARIVNAPSSTRAGPVAVMEAG